MDKIKIKLWDTSSAYLKGAHYFVMEGTENIFYDATGKELWREQSTTE